MNIIQLLKSNDKNEVLRGDNVDKKELEYYVEYFNRQEGRPYPISNQIVTCAIITNNRDKALSIMNKKGATIKRQTYNSIDWELNNERWIWRIWNNNTRGYRFYKVIVDKDIDEELFRYAVVYCASYCCSMEIV